MSPTQRSLALLRSEGFIADVCERWVPGANVRRDLFGLGDILAFHPVRRVIMLVQTTTRSNLATRRKKADALKAMTGWTQSGGEIEFHGWKKVKGRWQCTRWAIEATDPAFVPPASSPPAKRRHRSDRQELAPLGQADAIAEVKNEPPYFNAPENRG